MAEPKDAGDPWNAPIVLRCGTQQKPLCLTTDSSPPSLLNSGAVPNKNTRHLQSLRGNVADRSFEVVRDPLNKVGGVLTNHIHHLLVHLLGRHASAEEHRAGEIASVARVCGAHHILGVECLGRQLGNGEYAVLLRSAAACVVLRALVRSSSLARSLACLRKIIAASTIQNYFNSPCQGSKPDHEKVKAREGDHVDSQLAEIAIELAREAETAGSSTQSGSNQIVEISISWSGELQSAEADVVQGLVIESVHLVSILHELVNG